MKFIKRFYNVFKPHICQFSTGEYSVRRWSLRGWIYLDTDIRGSYARFWWSFDCALKYCVFTELSNARSHLENYLKPNVAFTRRVE